MNPEFKYFVVSTNVDGNTSTARFMNATSAYRWAERLKIEGTPMSLLKKGAKDDITITLADLRKEAGPNVSASKKTGRNSNRS